MPISRRSVCRTGRCRCSRAASAPTSNTGGGRIAILSTTWQTVALMAPQDHGLSRLHRRAARRMAQAGSQAELIARHRAADLCRRAGVAGAACDCDDRTAGPRARDRRIRRRAVPGRLCRAVRLADRRLHQAQPAAELQLRSACRKRCCRNCCLRCNQAAMKCDFATVPRRHRGGALRRYETNCRDRSQHATADRRTRLPRSTRASDRYAVAAGRSAVHVRHPRGRRRARR